MPEMTMTLESVGPVKAAEYLKQNNVNRRLRKNRIQQFKDIIDNDEWQTTHQGIAFSEDGNLIDGQHRLNAIVESGSSVEIMVVRGVPHKTALEYSVDNGAKRSAADILGRHRAEVEPITRLARLYTGSNARTPLISRMHTALLPELQMAMQCTQKSRMKRATSNFVAAIVVLLVKYPDRQQEICDQYRKFVHLEFDGLWSSVKAMLRHMDTYQYSSTDHGACFAKAMYVFDPANKDVGKVHPGEYTKYRLAAKDVIRKRMGE